MLLEAQETMVIRVLVWYGE